MPSAISWASSLVRDRIDGARQERQASFGHQVAGDRLVADTLHNLRPRADEGDAVLGANLGEVRVLGQEAIARVNGVGASLERGADNARDAQVTSARRRWPDVDRFIGKADDRRIGVGSRVHGHRPDTQLAACSGNPQRDLATVCNQYFLEHRASDGSSTSGS